MVALREANAKAAYERFLTTYMPAFREYYEKEGNVNARHDHPILGKLLNHIRRLGPQSWETRRSTGWMRKTQDPSEGIRP